jgi:hypothetical protein
MIVVAKYCRALIRGLRVMFGVWFSRSSGQVAESQPTDSCGDHICETCGSVGWPVRVTKGSFAVELALYLLFCFPGIIYTLWRATSTHEACRDCGGKMIALDSPRGRVLLQTYHRTQT